MSSCDRYGGEPPVYFNIIRDPLQRMVSWYYFRRYQYGHERELPTDKRVRVGRWVIEGLVVL